MKFDRIKDIADAVLYEGYILYPYRPSSIKNRQRWTFGCIFPRAFAVQGDSSTMQTQVLLRAGPDTTLAVHVRFLQVQTREVGSLPEPVADHTPALRSRLTLAPRLMLGGKEYIAWDEAIERQIAAAELSIAEIAARPRRTVFHFPATQTTEPIANSAGAVAGLIVRSSCAIDGVIEISAQALADGIYRATVRIENTTALSAVERSERALAQRRALASTHTILALGDGAFVSLMDPPEELREAAAACDNQGTWPVLVGNEGDTDAVLSSPIILYDYPQVAAQSAGDLYDATEIDEILTLRVLAMTDEEKREMAAADVRGRALLERTHGLTAAELARMHGTMRPTAANGPMRHAADAMIDQAARKRPRLASLMQNGLDLAVGAQVRLRPKRRGDIMDLALTDKVAIVEAIERDFEDRVHIAVTLRDDPGRDLGVAGFPGHRFYFSQDEIEPLGVGDLT